MIMLRYSDDDRLFDCTPDWERLVAIDIPIDGCAAVASWIAARTGIY